MVYIVYYVGSASMPGVIFLDHLAGKIFVYVEFVLNGKHGKREVIGKMYKFEVNYIVKKSHKVVIDGKVITVIDDLKLIDVSIISRSDSRRNVPQDLRQVYKSIISKW